MGKNIHYNKIKFNGGFYNVSWDSLWYVPKLPLHSEISLIKCYVPCYSSLNIPGSLGLHPGKLFNIPSAAPCTSLRNTNKNCYHNVLKLPTYLSKFPTTLSTLGSKAWVSLVDYYISSIYLVQGLTHTRFSISIYTDFLDKKTDTSTVYSLTSPLPFLPRRMLFLSTKTPNLERKENSNLERKERLNHLCNLKRKDKEGRKREINIW